VYLLDRLDPGKTAVLFFDEFPWLHTPRSNFLRAIDHWWNSSGTKRSHLKVVICGSAASWMIEKILNDRPWAEYLAQKAKGLTRDEIITECKFTTSGGMTQMLKELAESGFISAYVPFGKFGNENIYKLSDEYSLFYQRYIEHAKATGNGTWLRQLQTHSYISWSGFAFESVCHKHSQPIKKALGIADVLTEESAWRYQPRKESKDTGAQIDLLFRLTLKNLKHFYR